MDTWVWILIIVAALLLVGFRANRSENKRRALLQEQDRAYAADIEKEKQALLTSANHANLPLIPPQSIGYRPVGGEKLLAVQDGVSRLEYKSTGRYSTRGASFSIPIVRGVRYRVGGGSIRGEKTWQATAEGRLLITDKAVVFESSTRNERIGWGQIAAVQLLRDGLEIAKRSGPPRLFTVDRPDPKFSAVIELILARTA